MNQNTKYQDNTMKLVLPRRVDYRWSIKPNQL